MSPESRLTLAYLTGFPREAARELERLPPREAAALLAPLPPAAGAAALRHGGTYAGARVLEAMQPAQAAALLATLPSASATALLRAVAQPRRAALLAHLPSALAAAVERALTFPRQSAGALADPFALTLAADSTAGQALDLIRAQAGRAEQYLYVLDDGARLAGVTTLKALLLRPPGEPLSARCGEPVHSLSAESGVQDLLAHPMWHAYPLLPVVMRDATYVGALRWGALHGAAADRATSEPERLSDALLQLWELYSMAGLNLMTGVASGVNALASAGHAGEPTADDAPRAEPTDGPREPKK